MKKLSVLLIVGCIISAFIISGTAQAAVPARHGHRVNAFAGDNPSFISGGKVILPAGQPGSNTVAVPGGNPTTVRYYSDGRVQSKFYAVPSNDTGLQGITIMYLDEGPKGGNNVGRISSITINQSGLYPSYSIEYYGKTKDVKAITYTDAFGNKQVWNYNSTGTLKSYDSYSTTGQNYGNTMEQSAHADYSYAQGRHDELVVTKTAYGPFRHVIDTPGGGHSNGLSRRITITVMTYDQRGNLISETIDGVKQPLAQDQPKINKEADQKITMTDELNKAKDMPKGVSLVHEQAAPDKGVGIKK